MADAQRIYENLVYNTKMTKSSRMCFQLRRTVSQSKLNYATSRGKQGVTVFPFDR